MAVSSSLISRIVSGGLWSFAFRIVSRGVGLIRTIILARLLFPEDFGQIGIVMTIFTLLDCVSQFGFSQALIHRKDYDKGHLDTIWTASLLRSVVLFAILFGAAPLAAGFFEIDRLTVLMRVVAVSVLLTGFTNVSVALFQKEFDFKKYFLLEAISSLVELVFSVSAAYYLKNVWALVFGGMAINLSRLLLSYLLHPYRPSLCIDTAKFLELFAFGRWILLAGVVITVITQGDSVFVAKAFGAVAVGYYQMAFLVTNLLATEITNTVSQLVFPSYSKIREKQALVQEGFLHAFQFIVVLCFPLSAGVFVLASDFSKIFLGEKWAAIVPLIQIMSILGSLRAFGGAAISLFWGMGVPNIVLRYSAIQLIALAFLIVPLSFWLKLEGVALAVVGSYMILETLYARKVISLIGTGWLRFLRIMVAPGLASLAMMGVIGSLKVSLGEGATSLVLLVFIGAASYAGLLFVVDAVFMASRARILFLRILNATR
jgi:O-antigen/teichoic acid export membrane protein